MVEHGRACASFLVCGLATQETDFGASNKGKVGKIIKSKSEEVRKRKTPSFWIGPIGFSLEWGDQEAQWGNQLVSGSAAIPTARETRAKGYLDEL